MKDLNNMKNLGIYNVSNAKLPDRKSLLLNLIDAAYKFGLNYIFIDKQMIDDNTINSLKIGGYSVIVGQGEKSRVKISW
jgi:hypothetical protein